MEEINKFNAKLKEDRDSDNRLCTGISERQYNVLITKVSAAKLNISYKVPSDNILLSTYDVYEENNVKRLIVPSEKATKIYYVHDGELYAIFQQAHLETKHGMRDQMMKYLKTTYKNISYKDITTFLSLCKECNRKRKKAPTEEDKRRALFNHQCFVDIIDYQTSPDNDYKFILLYRELHTKFAMLKPLKSSRVEEIADNLINIFGILGPPILLQSSCTDKFLNEIIDMLKILWHPLQIRSVKAEDAQSSEAENVENMLTSWMRSNSCSRWSEGVKFVQLIYNTTLNSEINCTPYEALFKHSIKVGPPKQTEDDDFEKLLCDEELDYFGDEELDDLGDEENETDATNGLVEVKVEVMEICKTESEVENLCASCGNSVDKGGECICCRNK